MADRKKPRTSTQAPTVRTNEVSRPLTRQLAFLLSVILLILTGFSSSLSLITLSPVYGSLPPTLYHQTALACTAFITFAIKNPLKKILPCNKAGLIPVLAFYIPVAQSFLFGFSGDLGATYGPLVTECLSLLPLVVLSLHVVFELAERLDLRGYNSGLAALFIPAVCYVVLYAAEVASNAFLPQILGANFVFTRIALQYLLASAYTIILPSKWLLLIFPSLLHLAFYNVHVSLPMNNAMLKSTLQNHGFRLLDRQESVTGYISVLENTADGFRVMRCDHALLGGEWLVTPERVRQGITVKEPVYAVFSMLEAVRLIVGEDYAASRDEVEDKDRKALVIGLGTGSAPTALLHHGINTTIVELDPTVHAFATRYFDLPSNHTAVIQDAVTWVEEAVNRPDNGVGSEEDKETKQYDYIIHDVFTGGAEPLELFTLEFLRGLYELLRPGGGIAINYAADLSLPTTPVILRTILSIFHRENCRIFRDQPPLPSSSSPPPYNPQNQTPPSDPEPDFVNAVLFCQKPSASTLKSSDGEKHTWSFRPPVPRDHLNSHSRKAYIPPPGELEMDVSSLLRPKSKSPDANAMREGKRTNPDEGGRRREVNVLRKGDEKTMREMRKWQVRGAVRHWEIMRGVLPGGVWEAW